MRNIGSLFVIAFIAFAVTVAIVLSKPSKAPSSPNGTRVGAAGDTASPDESACSDDEISDFIDSVANGFHLQYTHTPLPQVGGTTIYRVSVSPNRWPAFKIEEIVMRNGTAEGNITYRKERDISHEEVLIFVKKLEAKGIRCLRDQPKHSLRYISVRDGYESTLTVKLLDEPYGIDLRPVPGDKPPFTLYKNLKKCMATFFKRHVENEGVIRMCNTLIAEAEGKNPADIRDSEERDE